MSDLKDKAINAIMAREGWGSARVTGHAWISDGVSLVVDNEDPFNGVGYLVDEDGAERCPFTGTGVVGYPAQDPDWTPADAWTKPSTEPEGARAF